MACVAGAGGGSATRGAAVRAGAVAKAAGAAPGCVETPLIEQQVSARATTAVRNREDGIRELLKEKQPSLRMSLPAEIADTALWLCRREAHNITGTAIPVDGAWTAQ